MSEDGEHLQSFDSWLNGVKEDAQRREEMMKRPKDEILDMVSRIREKAGEVDGNI